MTESTTERTPVLRIENLQKSFGSLQVLKGITENIYEGEKIAVIGPSGGGKSTFTQKFPT